MVDANHTVEQLLGVRPEIEFLVVHPHATGEGRLQAGGDILLVASVNILAVGSVEVDLEPLVESRDGPEAVRAYAQLGNGLGIARLNDVTRGQSPTAQNGFYLPGTDLCEEVVELEVHIQLLQVELVVTMDGA